MKQQASVWLVAAFLVLAMGLVYALSSQSPGTATPNAPAASSESPEVAEASVFSPDLTKSKVTSEDAYGLLTPPPVDSPAPDFIAKTADGKNIKLSDFKGKKNVVLVFYQGSFCSMCGAQLTNIQSHLADFKKQDAEIIAISADDEPHALQTLGEHGLTFNVVPDPKRQIIKTFGVRNASKQQIAWPSLFVVDKKGIIKLSFATRDGHRMHSNEILPVLSQITGKPAPKLSYDQ